MEIGRENVSERIQEYVDSWRTRSRVNVGSIERGASVLGGVLLALNGLKRRSIGGLIEALVGGGLIYRGTTGHCSMYSALQMNTAARSAFPAAIRVQRSIRVNRDPQSVYAQWRRLENLPEFMDTIESVTVLDERRSRWVAKGPIGTYLEWESEIVEDVPGHHIAWRSVEGAPFKNSGAVGFVSQDGGRSTEVKVSVQYEPPGGYLGEALARLLGQDAKRQLERDLSRFKQMVESGRLVAPSVQPASGASMTH